jgi:type II secretory pathway pseudopilin PulG
MAHKYTILKVLLQNSNKGFTLLELLFGMLITVLIGGFAMNAVIEASTSFGRDKKNIDASQNFSAILEIIGTDIRQTGEQFIPAIEFITNTDAGAMAGSSKITIRRSIAAPLTLCLGIPASTSPTALRVLDTTLSVPPSTNGNCNPGTNISMAPAMTPAPALPTTLRAARNYRCQLDNPDPDYAYATTDACGTPTASLEKVKAAVSDTTGRFRTFDYTNENLVTANSQYTITVAGLTPSARNNVAYSIGNPIYLIEERVYTLDSTGNLLLTIDGGNPVTLIKRIQKFRISAKLYEETVLNPLNRKIINTAPTASCPADTSAPVNTAFAANAEYTCTFQVDATSTTAAAYNWKTIAGVKVELQGAYDATGQNVTPTDTDLRKITARAEFFPRNVLSN